MEKQINVTVFRFGARSKLYMQYLDPVTERKVTKTTGTSSRKDAVKVAAKWEAELQEGRYVKPSKTSWADFRAKYDEEVLPRLAEKTRSKITTVLNAVEKIVGPKKLRSLDSAEISRFQAQLRKNGLAETTINGYMSHLAAALTWAVDLDMLPKLPKIPKPERAKKGDSASPMKGRPITSEEFERMLERVPAVVGQKAAPSWDHYLRGLWWSGLRLEESLELYWDRPDRIRVDLDGRRPMLLVPGECHKSGKDTWLPIAPEFAQMLLAVPVEQRTGRVFRLQPRREHGERLTTCRVSRIVTEIGKAANVKVSTTGPTKYASAHDLRRAFGERWARRPGVTVPVLKELMRHSSIDTTMRYYVGQNSEATADVLWAALDQPSGGNVTHTPANTHPNLTH